MKKLITSIISAIIRMFSATKVGLHINQIFVTSAMNRHKEVKHNSIILKFCTPNKLNNYRVDTFATKEPETLEWLDAIPKDAIIWDIGANIGLYSIYAAKVNNCRVYAFEPSVFNLELLARNIFLNKLQQQVTIVPVALTDKLSESLFQMSSVEWGGALSTFGAGIDQNGKPMSDVFEYKAIGLSMNEVVRVLNIPFPQFIKMDVDGIEHFILKGGAEVLAQVESVLIEINENFPEQFKESEKHLSSAGLSLLKKCNVDSNIQFNQWWVR